VDAGVPDAGVCALYGQSCEKASDCCSGIPCLAPGAVPCAGQGNCHCYIPVK
jgi:hypothetical protein